MVQVGALSRDRSDKRNWRRAFLAHFIYRPAQLQFAVLVKTRASWGWDDAVEHIDAAMRAFEDNGRPTPIKRGK
jgi:hypothetical protein